MSDKPVGAESQLPDQPLQIDRDGVIRFRANSIVRFLLDDGPNDMNRLARLHFNKADRRQFAQLIGYSVSGYGELEYVDDQSYNRASRKAARLLKGVR